MTICPVNREPISSKALSQLQLSIAVSTPKSRPVEELIMNKRPSGILVGPWSSAQLPRLHWHPSVQAEAFSPPLRILTCKPSRQYRRRTRLTSMCKPSHCNKTWISSYPNFARAALAISCIRKSSCRSRFEV
jgi:hypothetical protein